MIRNNINWLQEYLLSTKTALCIVGPTASGKTALSLQIGLLLEKCEIISADSRQFYRGMTIGTAKPSSDELLQVPHHFIDCAFPDEHINAGDFGNKASLLVEELFTQGKIPIIVGGSGLFVKSLCEGLFDENATFTSEKVIHNDRIREKLQQRLTDQGIDALYEELRNVDIISYHKYSDKNPRRILRALEFYSIYQRAISEAHQLQVPSRNFTTLYIAPQWERADLYKRINLRTEIMLKNGLIEETQSLLQKGYSPELQALQTVGYKEVIQYLSNDITYERMAELIAQNTRRYAKRQLTWFTKIPNIQWFSAENFTANFVLEQLSK